MFNQFLFKVFYYDDFIETGSFAKAKELGKW